MTLSTEIKLTESRLEISELKNKNKATWKYIKQIKMSKAHNKSTKFKNIYNSI